MLSLNWRELYQGDHLTSKPILHLTPNSRAVRDIFQEVSGLEDTSYILRVSFVELYNEQLFDLLSLKPRREDTMVDIREDGKGIKIPGLTEVEVRAI